MLALITTTGGFPLTYEMFPGNTFEGHTLIPVINKLRARYNVREVTLVADRAMFNEKTLQKLEAEQVNYIVAAKLKALPKELKEQVMASEDYRAGGVADELHWFKELAHKKRRLIVSYSRERAVKDAKDRARLIERILKKFKNGTCKLSDLISNHGTKRYLKVEGGRARLNETKIATDKQWDGLHGIITNVKSEQSTGPALLARYRELWQIEAAFRVSKHDLAMRPIFHFTPNRIRAHIALCFFAFALVKHALHRIEVQQKKSLSFERLRNELLHVQSSILYDQTTGQRYRLPSNVTLLQQKIYQTFGLRRSNVPTRFHKPSRV